MNKDNYPENMPKEFKPIRPWGYVGYFWLYKIPIVGLIFMIIYALDDTNINRRNLARGHLWNKLIGLVLGIIFALIMSAFIATVFTAIASHYANGSSSSLDSIIEDIKNDKIYDSDYGIYNELFDNDDDDYDYDYDDDFDYDDDEDYIEKLDELYKEYKLDDGKSNISLETKDNMNGEPSVSIDANDDVAGENSAINIGI